MQVTFFIDNKLGGVSSLCYNLMKNADQNLYEQKVIHIDLEESDISPANVEYPNASNLYFHYSLNENAYKAIERLNKMLPDEHGALVLNYGLEMQMLDHYPVPQTVFQLVHDDYNLKLSKKYGHIADVFISHNHHIFESLQEMLPHRKDDIFYLPHGVTIPLVYQMHENDSERGPIKLLFLGRMSKGKGIHDLPVISEMLRQKGVQFQWVCIGNGPELETLKKNWHTEDAVQFLSPASNEEVINICSEQDVFVLPTKFEGSPVSLLETMSVGLVPVITDLAGGIREIVDEKIGFRIPENDNMAFANAIDTLYRNRPLLKSLSKNCRARIEEKFDIRQTSVRYYSLFSEFEKRYKQKKIKKLKVGSRLDQSWLPSFITRSIRNRF